MALSVNGVEIGEAEVLNEMARLRSEYEAYVKANGGEPSESQLREWAEEDLIEEAVFRQEAAATQPVPSDERAQQFVDDYADLFKGVPAGERLARGKVMLQQRRLMKELRKGVKQPDEADIRAYYEAHTDLFVMPETLRLSHICRFVDPLNKANTFLDLLRVKSEVEGFRINWVEAVETYSDSFSRDNGLFEAVSRGSLPPEIESKLFALNPGEVSDVIDLGGRTLHLFRLLVKEPPQKLEFKDVKERLSEVLFEEACREALDTRFDGLKTAAVIRREA